MNHLDNSVSLFFFILIGGLVTFFMMKLLLLNYFKGYKNINKKNSKSIGSTKQTTEMFLNRIQNTSDFLIQNKNKRNFYYYEDDQPPPLVENDDLLFYSVSLCDFFSKFDCRNFSKGRQKRADKSKEEGGGGDGGGGVGGASVLPTNPLITKTLFALPNGAVINKNFSLSQPELDAAWNQGQTNNNNNPYNNDDDDQNNNNDSDSSSSLLPFKKKSCTRHPIIFIHVYGTYGNERNFKIRAQKTACGCKSHKKLFTFPSATSFNNYDLQIDKPGVNVLRFPLPGVKPLIEKMSESSSNRYLLNTNGEIIFSDPCSQFKDGSYKIDDILIKYSDINALRTKRPNLFSEFMETKKAPRKVICKSQQVLKLL